jgi:hypothetical protein
LEEEIEYKEVYEPYGFIYITTNMINGKRYIGQRKFYRNWNEYLGSGKLIKRAIEKYGKQNFNRTIVAIAFSEEQLNIFEKEWINLFDSDKNEDYYNIAQGGHGNTLSGLTDIQMKELKIKQSIASTGRTHTESTKKKMSEWHTGKIVSEETRQKISKINKGKVVSDESKLKMSQSQKGRIHSEESINKMKKSREGKYTGENSHWFGRKHTEETKIKMTDSRNSREDSSQKIICITTNIIYKSIREASRKTNAKFANIRKCCIKEILYSGTTPYTNEPLIWMYIEEWEVLSETEKINLKLELLNSISKPKPKNMKILCVETNETFKSRLSSSKFFKVSDKQIAKVIGDYKEILHPLSNIKVHLKYIS